MFIMARLLPKFDLAFLLVFIVVNISYNAAQSRSPEQELMKRLFDSHYDRRIRPANSSSGPVYVTVNMFLRSVSKLDEINNEVNVQLTYRQKWRDERLSFSRAAGDIRYINLINPENYIWKPDTFFSNEKEGHYHNIMTRNEFVRLSPNGEILHSSRISLKLSCPMNFKSFPFDRQTCPIRFASYGYTTSDVVYMWEAHNPVQLMPLLNLATHKLEGIETVKCDSTTTTGSYSCLRADFTFKRLFTPYLLNVYIPCMMLFLVSCLTFWIDIQAFTARLIVLVPTLLVFAIQTAEINKTFPPTGYTKAVDVWTGMCLTFVFAALVECVIVQYFSKGDAQQNTMSSSSSKNNLMSADEVPTTQRAPDVEQEIPLKEIGSSEDTKEPPQPEAGLPAAATKMKQQALDTMQKYVSRFESLPEKIDGVSRVAFPAIFLVFVILYWPVYCLAA